MLFPCVFLIDIPFHSFFQFLSSISSFLHTFKLQVFSAPELPVMTFKTGGRTTAADFAVAAAAAGKHFGQAGSWTARRMDRWTDMHTDEDTYIRTYVHTYMPCIACMHACVHLLIITSFPDVDLFLIIILAQVTHNRKTIHDKAAEWH